MLIWTKKARLTVGAVRRVQSGISFRGLNSKFNLNILSLEVREIFEGVRP